MKENKSSTRHNFKILNRYNRIKLPLILGGILVVAGVLLSLPNAFADLTPVKSITITSEKLDYTKKDPGSFNIEKSAKWISKGKARITFDLDTIMKTEKKYTDIIFVLDISGSMDGDKLTRVKQDSIDLINTLLSDSNNRGALITFETTSQLVLGLTNNKDELTNAINSLTTTGCTNYYQALVNVDNILNDYKKEENRECIVLFLTDGYPNEDTPNEEGQYNYLRKQYPYVTINGVQYEMGSDVLDPIKKVSDYQFIADMTNLNNVLFVASVAPITYDSFSITDYINDDYFEIDGIDSIVASVGTTKLEYEGSTPKLIWNIGNIRSGLKAQLTIDVKLKDEYLNKGGVYPTNKKEEIKTEIDGVSEDITSKKAPILSSHYQVIYDGNAPVGCTTKNIPETSTRSVFDTVEISNQSAVCDGYQFKGWTITTENVKKINDNYFEMPSSDVVIRANWGKMDIAKSMDGEVFKAQNLYKIIAEQASLDRYINFSEKATENNGIGVYTITDTKDYEYPVHYFRGAVENNNVKFAGFCWKIVRTTETGGIKLIYNGVPDSDGGCTNTKNTDIGNSEFNSNYRSPAFVGYMYGERYYANETRIGEWYEYAGKKRTIKSNMETTEYYYGDSVMYDEATNTYTLVNQTKYLWSENYSDLKGKYTCFKDTEEGCETISYIEMGYESSLYYIDMKNGENYENLMEKAKSVKWIYGNDVEYVNGKYVLKDAKKYFPWEHNSKTSDIVRRYTCLSENDSCTSVNYFYYGNYHLVLTKGDKVNDALRKMTFESSNTTDSTIKQKIDTWYENNMLDYTQYLEDTVWCNDRSIQEKKGWDKDSTANGDLYFGGKERQTVSPYKPSVECANDNDKFTVNNTNGNGKLTYPVALLTANEATLAGNGSYGRGDKYTKNSYLCNNKNWWLLSPSIFTQSTAYCLMINDYGMSVGYYTYVKYGVRPAISLTPGILVSDGNGSTNSPFEVFLPETN